VVPEEGAGERAGGDVELELFGRHLHRAFEHVQLRTDGEHVEHRCIAAHLARENRVALARGIAGTHQQAPGLFAADGAHQLTAQRAECCRMDQQHALAGEPDATVAGREMEQPTQVGVGRERGRWWSGHFLIIEISILPDGTGLCREFIKSSIVTPKELTKCACCGARRRQPADFDGPCRRAEAPVRWSRCWCFPFDYRDFLEYRLQLARTMR